MGRPSGSTGTIATLLGLGTLMEGGLLGLVLLVHRLPDAFSNFYGYFPTTLSFFLDRWGWSRPVPVSSRTFQWLYYGLWLGLHILWLLAFRRNRPWLGYILLLLSVLIRYVSVLLLLFLLLAWIYRQEKLRARLLLLAKAVLLGLATALVAVLPFWHSPQVVLTALLGETTRIRVSLSVLLLRGLERAWAAWPATAPRAEPLAILTTQLVLKGLLVAWVVFQAVALWRRHRGEFGPLLEVWEGTALVYVVFLHGATFPWYFTWPASVSASLPSPGCSTVCRLDRR